MSTREAVTVVLRTESGGGCIAVFSGVGDGSGGAVAFSPTDEHFSVDRGYYQQRTRPAGTSECGRVLAALEARSYDVTVAKRMVWA